MLYGEGCILVPGKNFALINSIKNKQKPRVDYPGLFRFQAVDTTAGLPGRGDSHWGFVAVKVVCSAKKILMRL